jgi:hypothetical protein
MENLLNSKCNNNFNNITAIALLFTDNRITNTIHFNRGPRCPFNTIGYVIYYVKLEVKRLNLRAGIFATQL